MAGVGELSVSVTARTQKARKNIKGFRSEVGMVPRVVQRASQSLSGLAAAAGAMLGIGAIGREISQSFSQIDNLAKTSDKLGIATEKLAAYRFAAEETGVATRTFDMGLQRMVRRVSEAAQGTGEARGALQELGLSAQKLASMSPDQQFSAIADAMSRVNNQSDKIRLAMRLFDSEGVALVNTLKIGSEGLTQYEKAAQSLGISVNRLDASKIEKANDAMGRLRMAAGGLSNELAIALSPALTSISTAVTEMLRATGQWGARTLIVGGALTTIAVIAPRVIGAVRGIVSAVKMWRNAQIGLLAVSGPAGWALLAGGVVAAGAAVYGMNQLMAEQNAKLSENANNTRKAAVAHAGLAGAMSSYPVNPLQGSTTSKSGIGAEIDRLRRQRRELEIGANAAQRERFVAAGASTVELHNLKALQEQTEELRKQQELQKKRTELSRLMAEQQGRGGKLIALQQQQQRLQNQVGDKRIKVELPQSATKGSEQEFQLMRQMQQQRANMVNQHTRKQIEHLSKIETKIQEMASAAETTADRMIELKTAIENIELGRAV